MVLDGPSFGNWLNLMRESWALLSAGARSPLAELLITPQTIAQAREALAAHEGFLGGRYKGLKSLIDDRDVRGVIGAMNFFVAFRNCRGHSAQFPEKFAATLAPPLFTLALELVSHPGLLDGGTLVRTARDPLHPGALPFYRLLKGSNPELAASTTPGFPPPESLDSQVLQIVAPSKPPVSLACFVIEHGDATGLSRFGFLHGHDSRKKGDGTMRLRMLDYKAGNFDVSDFSE